MVDKHYNALGDSISSLVDNQASELDLRRVLKSAADDDVRRTWRRYHLMQASLKGEIDQTNQKDLSVDIWAAIEHEPLPEMSKHAGVRQQKPWSAFVGKAAVAASVATVCLLGMQYVNIGVDQHNVGGAATVAGVDSDVNSPAATVKSSASALSNPEFNQPPAGFERQAFETRQVSSVLEPRRQLMYSPLFESSSKRSLLNAEQAPDPAIRDYLNQLLLIHAEHTSSSGAIGVNPYARVSHLQENVDDE